MTLRLHILAALWCAAAAFQLSALATIVPVAEDSASNSRDVITVAAGKAPTLPVNPKSQAFIRFDSSALAASATAENLVSAKLTVYFSRVIRANEISVHQVTAVWTEKEGETKPTHDPSPVAVIPGTAVVGKRFAEVDVTPLVRAWLQGAPNHGVAIATTEAKANIGAKEGPGVGYPAELQLTVNPQVTTAGDFTFSGYVGIGTETPAFPLEVRTGVGEAGFAHTDGSLAMATFISGSTGWFGTQTDHAMGLMTNNVRRLTIDASGRVGIGTTTPDELLHVGGRLKAEDVQLTNNAGLGRFLTSSSSGIGTWTNVIRQQGGNFGIGLGDAVPSARLHVANGISGFSPTPLRTTVIESSGNVDVAFRVSAENAQHNLYFERPVHDSADSEDGAVINVDNTAMMKIGQFRFTSDSTNTSTYHFFLNLVSGRLGLGRIPVNNQLEISGNASKSTAGNWLANSDRRIKTDVRDISDARQKVMRLRPVVFRYSKEWLDRNPEIEDREYHNFIAQEYRDLFPWAVKGSGEFLPDDPQEILQVDTYDAQIVAIKAVQELVRENDGMRESMENLHRENAQLRERLDALVERLSRLEQQ